MKKALQASSIIGVVILVLKIISLMMNFDTVFGKSSSTQRVVQDIETQSAMLATAKGYFFNDSLQQWVVNQNIIAQKSTTNPDDGLNFIRIKSVGFVEDSKQFYAFIYTSKGYNTNSQKMLELFPPVEKYNCDYAIFSNGNYKALRSYLNSSSKDIITIKVSGVGGSQKTKNHFTEKDHIRSLSSILYAPYWGIESDKIENYSAKQATKSYFLVQKVNTDGEDKVRFLLPSVNAPRSLSNKTILTQKYFECPLDSFKKIILP